VLSITKKLNLYFDWGIFWKFLKILRYPYSKKTQLVALSSKVFQEEGRSPIEEWYVGGLGSLKHVFISIPMPLPILSWIYLDVYALTMGSYRYNCICWLKDWGYGYEP
jgi:hypothetical protein